jgi:hypothetical protein
MTKAERQLRFVQLACILFLVICIVLVYFGVLRNREPSPTISLMQGIVVLLALWSAISGFTLQRRLLSVRAQRASTKSTPFTRWRAGHIFRLWSAMAVGVWGLVLNGIRGPLWIVGVLLAVGLILLLIWRPGAIPVPE